MFRRIPIRLPWVLAVATFSILATMHVASAQDSDPRTLEQQNHQTAGEHVGNDHGGGHSDPFSFVLLELALVVVFAILGRWVADRLGQPAVLGELVIGVAIGNIGYWFGAPFFVLVMHLSDANLLFEQVWQSGASVVEAAREVFTVTQLAEGGVGHALLEVMTGPGSVKYILMGIGLWMFSSLGVILLLFMVGLESSVSEMLRVGARALIVAILGIVAPFALGFLASIWLIPEASTPAHLFISATLCATSVGITARVFKDLGTLQSPEAKVILGAAVIDDVLGLIILAIVVGIVATGQIDGAEITRICLLSVLFLGVVMLLGERLAGFLARCVHLLDQHNNKLLFPLALAFVMSWLANQIELATIVGAFAAGLIIDESQFPVTKPSISMEQVIAPLEKIFAPVFFVLMGMQVNLSTFLDGATLQLALALTVVAVIGKIVCGLPAGPGNDKLTVGTGMIPRGEVGLIFASIGRGLGVVNDSVFSAIVIMVMVTTLITPPALKWTIARANARSQ